MSFPLSPESQSRIQLQLESGRFKTADEVVDAALSALDELDARRAELQAELRHRKARAEQGDLVSLELDEFLAAARRRLIGEL